MKKAFYTILILLIITLGLLFFLRQKNSPQKVVENKTKDFIEVTFLDIGQGDATFVEWPDGTQMLIDCAVDARVLEALGRNMDFYDKTIDYLLVTHPDLDHYGGCTDVLKRFEVKNYIHTGFGKEENKSWQYFLQTVAEENLVKHQIVEPQIWQFASSSIEFLYPDHNLERDSSIPGSEKPANANNASIAFFLSLGENKILFTGDAEDILEEYLIAKYGEKLDVEVLKAGHHGSASSSIEPFVQLTSPEHFVVSAGLDNRFGHPSRRVLKRVERVNSTVWRTDTMGDIKLKLYPEKLIFE